jgi:hypothetical protein
MMTEFPPRPAHPKGLAAYRPYLRGHDQEKDEELAEELFLGRLVVDAAGRSRRKYPAKNSPRERLAREALARIVTYYTGEDGPPIMYYLSGALTCVGAKRIDFKFDKRGGKSDLYADLQISVYYRGIKKPGRGRGKAAIDDTMQKFGLSRKAVFEALRRVKSRWRS